MRHHLTVLAIVLAAAASPASSRADNAPEQREPQLLQRARRIAAFRGDGVIWAACLPSADTALYLRCSDSYRFTFLLRNLLTGADTPLRALGALHETDLGYGYQLSPNGKWLLWKNGQEETHWATIDGQHHGKMKGGISNHILWMADSRHWIEIGATGVFQYTRATIYDVAGKDPLRELTFGPDSPLAHADHRRPPVIFDHARLSPGGHLLVDYPWHPFEILDIDLGSQGMAANQYPIPFSSDVGVLSVAFSPDGGRIAWLLRREKWLLCVSQLDGSRLELIGALPVTPSDPKNPDSALNREPVSLQWTPDGQGVTFLYQNALFRAPANGESASALNLYRPAAPDGGATAVKPDLGEPLAHAAWEGDAASVKELLGKGAPVNYQDSEGGSPLMSSACKGHAGIVKLLLESGADPNLRDRFGDTALIKAVEADQDEAVLLLLAKGARPNVKGYFGRTALLEEAGKGSLPRRIRLENEGNGPAREPSLTVIKALLDHGADVNASGYENALPLIKACFGASLPVVELMVSRGANVNGRDAYGSSPLIAAVLARKMDLCKFLLDHGADPNVRETEGKTNGETPLIHAAYQGNLELCRLLVSKGAKVDTPDPAGYTPLSNAVYGGHIDLARFLLDKGANPNVRIIDSTLLICAVLNKRPEIAELLIQRGANVHAKGEYWGSGNRKQRTALGWAQDQHLENMVRLLKKAGADE